MAVFRQLGLIDLRATLFEGPTPEHTWWRFSVEPVLTAKGEKDAVEEPGGRGAEGSSLAGEN